MMGRAQHIIQKLVLRLFDLSQGQSDTGRYELRFSTLGQEFREEFSIIP
jgi:hypothetical protein